MKRSSTLVEDEYGTELNMTPMIDMIFNLLIFFMIVNKLAQEERADIKIPIADRAVLEKKTGPENRLTVNIDKKGNIILGGSKVTDEEFRQALKERIKDQEKGYPTCSILIRADIATEYRHIEKVMYECAIRKIYKISFAADLP